MTDPIAASIPPEPGEDARLADLAEAITRRLQAGEAIDANANAAVARLPDGAESIRDLLPTMIDLVELGRVEARRRRRRPPSNPSNP